MQNQSRPNQPTVTIDPMETMQEDKRTKILKKFIEKDAMQQHIII